MIALLLVGCAVVGEPAPLHAPVATRDLEIGHRIGPDDLQLAPLQGRALVPGALTDLEAAQGRGVRDPIFAGEQLVEARLGPVEDLPARHRLVPLPGLDLPAALAAHPVDLFDGDQGCRLAEGIRIEPLPAGGPAVVLPVERIGAVLAAHAAGQLQGRAPAGRGATPCGG